LLKSFVVFQRQYVGLEIIQHFYFKYEFRPCKVRTDIETSEQLRPKNKACFQCFVDRASSYICIIIEKNEMGGACGAYGGGERGAQGVGGET
jgi:hypothetical protein